MGRKTRYLHLCYALAFLLVAGMFLYIHPVSAASQASGKSIAQGFQATGKTSDIVAGALVSTKQNDARTIELTTIQNADKIVGIVDKLPLLAISSSTSEVQVVLGGTATTLVSDINGPVNPGDKITASPIAGVGMRATNDGRVVGTAQSRLDTRSSSIRKIKDTSGKEHDVHIGYIPIQIGVTSYQAPASSYLPPALQRVANGVAGRPVAATRVVIAGSLLLIGFTAVGIILYTTIRSIITALGRNPLASHSIHKGARQVIILTISSLLGIILAAYTILRI